MERLLDTKVCIIIGSQKRAHQILMSQFHLFVYTIAARNEQAMDDLNKERIQKVIKKLYEV